MVTGYVDGELPDDRRAALEEHLQGCPACRAQVGEERALRRQLQALPELEPRPGIEQRLRARIRAARPSPWRYLLPIAAGLAAVALWAGGSPSFVAWQLSRDHDRCFGAEKLPVEVFANTAADATERLAPAGTTLPVLPDEAGGLQLVGGRRCPLLDRRVVHFFYAAERRRLSVFVVPGNVREGPNHPVRVGGKAVRLLRVAGTTVGLVGERLEDVAALERALFVVSADGGTALGPASGAGLTVVEPRH